MAPGVSCLTRLFEIAERKLNPDMMFPSIYPLASSAPALAFAYVNNAKPLGCELMGRKTMLAARSPFAGWGGRMMMAFLAAGTTLAYVDERCGQTPPKWEHCTGLLEFILVVDNSWSMREHYDGISEFMRRVTDSFELDAQREFSPRVGIITIAGEHHHPNPNPNPNAYPNPHPHPNANPNPNPNPNPSPSPNLAR